MRRISATSWRIESNETSSMVGKQSEVTLFVPKLFFSGFFHGGLFLIPLLFSNIARICPFPSLLLELIYDFDYV